MTAEDREQHGAWRAWHEGAGPIRVGVSTCLLGENVRWDGGHKRDAWVVEELGRWVEWVSVCPEVELGMGVPRPSVRLVEVAPDEELRMLSPGTGEDFTARMRGFARGRVAELSAMGLDGYVLKQGSPSCGMARVRVHGFEGPKGRDGVGLFARELLAGCPHLPVEEEGRLADAGLRENFVERLFCRNRWRALVRGGRTRRRLAEFWSAHELVVRAHDEGAHRRLGRRVAREGPADELFREFEAGFFGALARKATAAKHARVLQHAFGRLRSHLDAGERARLAAVLEDFRRGLLPLVVPLTLFAYQIQRYAVEPLLGQLYFEPHPRELMLRNRA